MEKEEVTKAVAERYGSLPGNILTEEMDIDVSYAGTAMYDAPLTGFGAADDPLFRAYKDPAVIGPWHMSPEEWLPEGKAVVSLFFPASAAVRGSNRDSEGHASVLWTYARVDGQAYIHSFMDRLAAWFRGRGISACVPSSDPRWQQMFAGEGIDGFPDAPKSAFGSRWSERHAAYVCGLGTFCLSKGMITEKGVAGRFASVIVGEAFPADVRPYTGTYDYCTRCGRCAARCPAQAIDPVRGKDHAKCGAFVNASAVMFRPRYGCGLCQTGVPCESHIPGIRAGNPETKVIS